MSILSILLAILGLSVLVIVHEAGHYLVARYFGMRVLRFSIGLGPVIAKYQPEGSPTTFQICAIPFLAYVQIAGMHPQEDVDPNDPEIYANKGLMARGLTVLAGPAANYLLAGIIVFGLALHGWPTEQIISPMRVARVEAGSPAARAGIQAGDIIVEANGQAVADVNALIAVTSPRAEQATSYIVERNGQRLPPMSVTPKRAGERGVIGVVAEIERRFVPLPVGEAAIKSVAFPLELTQMQLEGIAQLFRKRSTEGLTGPIGMGKLVAQQAGEGWVEYISILMMLSVALGLFNLLPFPALDGGRLSFILFEAVTRQRPNEKIEAVIHALGLVFLLALLLLVTFRDVTS